jgi:hypothetical protein
MSGGIAAIAGTQKTAWRPPTPLISRRKRATNAAEKLKSPELVCLTCRLFSERAAFLAPHRPLLVFSRSLKQPSKDSPGLVGLYLPFLLFPQPATACRSPRSRPQVPRVSSVSTTAPTTHWALYASVERENIASSVKPFLADATKWWQLRFNRQLIGAEQSSWQNRCDRWCTQVIEASSISRLGVAAYRLPYLFIYP